MDFIDEIFQKMDWIGAHAAACLDRLQAKMVPGTSTAEIDAFVELYASARGLTCAPFGYRGFPAHCCTSVNHVVCHGIPSQDKLLKAGDIIKVDVTFKSQDGWHGDSCRTYAIGDISVKARNLIDATQNALEMAIGQCHAGAPLGIVGLTVETYAKSKGFSSVAAYCGHGIGQEFHTKPIVLHVYRPNEPDSSLILKPGMMFTIEPMLCVGKGDTKTLNDKWTVVTRDRSLSAQFEHTIGINREGPPTIFTRSRRCISPIMPKEKLENV